MASRSSSRVARLVVVLAVGIGAAAQDRGSDPAPASSSIREQDLRGDLSFIASDLLQGRLTGTVGNQLATEFIRARFERSD